MNKKQRLTWFKKISQIELNPCKFCGRLVLAGVCCQEALEEARANQTNAQGFGRIN